MSLKILGVFLVAFCLLQPNEAGFRCFFGDWACTAGCSVMGHRSGICGDNGQCWCSETSISVDDFRSLLPSRCSLGEEVCSATCNSIGRRSGDCTRTGCDCSTDTLSPSDFALCATETACRVSCQAKGRGSGRCVGWSCKCVSRS